MVDEEFFKKYNSTKLYWVFFLIFNCGILVNIDHGALPSNSEDIKEKMNIENFGFGALGTAVYVGVTIGCLKSTKVLSYQGSKQIVLSASMLINGLTLYAFTKT